MKTVGQQLITLVSFLILVSGHAQESSTYSKGSSGKVVHKHSNGFQSFNVEIRGKIEITDDDRDIKSMSPDGYLEITKTVFGSQRKLVITSQGGSLKREYYEGRTAVPYEPEGRKWLNEIMPELLRSTTIGAESRVNRFYKQGGVAAVLSEIGEMESDYVKHHYANVLMGISTVLSKDYATIVNRITGTFESDYYLAEFLQKNLSKFLTNKEATESVFAACGEMDSDHYKTEVIKEALRSQQPSVESIKIILTASGEMDSDHYKTEVLTSLMRQPNLTDPVIAEMINATKSLDSDHYRTLVLTKALAYKGLSSISYQRALESVKNFDSDHYKTEVLTSLLANKLPNDQIFTLVDLSNSIDSDHYLTVVFKEVLRRQDLNDESFKSLIDRASLVDSDHYASVILQSALELPNLTEGKITSVIYAAGNINSDHYITEVLVDAAPQVRNGSAALKEAYRKSAKKISSETYYGRALRAID